MTEPHPETLAEAVEEAAGEKLDIQHWDLPAIFRDAAEAAADADLPHWAVLVLSGAVATLGPATDSSARPLPTALRLLDGGGGDTLGVRVVAAGGAE